jgi:hypothetical protein
MEAFSDGVIAIIITIMVLELKVPHEASAASAHRENDRAVIVSPLSRHLIVPASRNIPADNGVSIALCEDRNW